MEGSEGRERQYFQGSREPLSTAGTNIFQLNESYGHQNDRIILTGCRGPIRGGAWERLEVRLISLWGAKRNRLSVVHDDPGRAFRPGVHGDPD